MTIKYLDSNRISVISSSCLVHFTLDEASGNPTNHATTANGFPLGTGSTNNGTNGSSGATQNVTGKFDKCFEFGGGDNKQVNIGTVLSGTGDFSISLWINHSNNNSNYASVVSNYGGGNTSGYQFYMNGTGNTISFHTSGSAINGGTAMSASAWHHVVVTRTSGVLNLYVDGSFDATAVANTHSISTSLSDAIGGKSDGTAGFNGKIDEVSIWLRGISASEVSKLYNGGTGDTLLEAKGLGKWNMEPTIEYDMTTDPRTGTFNVNTSYSTITHANSTIQLNCTSGSGDSGGSLTYIDLGSALSTKWLMRFRTKQSVYTNYLANSHHLVGFSSVAPTTTSSISPTNWVGTRWYYGTQYGSSANKIGIEPRISQNSSTGNHNNSTGVDRLYSSPNTITNTTTSYYHEYIWNVDTFTYNLYDNANYTGTPLATATLNSSTNTQWITGTPSSVTGLRYLVYYITNDHQLGNFTSQLDDVKIYDGVTSV